MKITKVKSQKKTVKSEKKTVSKISSSARLEDLLEETERELLTIQPKIDKLEKQLDQLKELKLAKQKLITLKLSIKSILSNFSSDKSSLVSSTSEVQNFSNQASDKNLNTKESQADFTKTLLVKPSLKNNSLPLKNAGKNFLPERAFQEVDIVLRKKTSINYDLFRAVVYNGGRASTEQIKAYLLEHDIRQPASGESFANVELTDISSRINYLVRKGIVEPEGRGYFSACVGWQESD